MTGPADAAAAAGRLGASSFVDPALEHNAWMMAAALGFLLVAGLAVLVPVLVGLARRPPSLPALRGALLERPWRWRHAGFLVVVLAAAYLGLALLQGMAGGAGGEGSTAAWVVAGNLGVQGIGLAAVAALVARVGGGWRRAFGGSGLSAPGLFGRAVLAYLAAFPFVLFAAVAGAVVLWALGVPLEPQPVLQLLVRSPSPAVLALAGLLAVVVAPCLEELFFRGVLFPAAARSVGVPGAMVFTAAVFAAIHGHAPSFAPLFVIGLAFCLVYYLTRSLWAAVCLHGVFNAVSLGLLVAMRYG